jgi:hypothetical protein
MHMPGFSAEMSLYQAQRFLVVSQPNVASTISVIPQRIKLPSNPGWEACMNDCASLGGTIEECYNSCNRLPIVYGYYF